jgi:hypothetical protein
MANQSGYNSEFIEHQAARRAMMKPKNNYEAPNARFEGKSTAKGDFVEKQIGPRESFRPKWEPVGTGAPFDDSTENKSSFVEKPVQARQARQKEVYVAPKAPFEATTTTGDSYQEKYQPKRESFRPNQAPLNSEKFDGRTTFRSDFHEHTVGPRYRHQPDTYVKPEGDMEMVTSHQSTFRDLGPAERQAVNKPGSSGVMRGQGAFQGGSSYNSDFTDLGPQPRRLFKPRNEYQPAEVPFDDKTTQRISYTGPYAPRQGNFKPAHRPLKQLDAFEDDTAYRHDYTATGWLGSNPQVPPVGV